MLNWYNKDVTWVLLLFTLLGFMGIQQDALAQSCNGDLEVSIMGASTAQPLIPSINVAHIECTGDTDGAASVMASGGNSGINFQWDNGSTANTLTGLGVGTYFVTVSDAVDCTATAEVVIEYLSPMTTDLADENGCGDCMMDDGTGTYFFNADNEYIGSISDSEVNGTQLGITEICANLDDNVEDCNGVPYLSRNWSVSVDNNDAACVKLYFTEAELTDLLGATSFADIATLVSNLCVTAFDGGGETCSDHVAATVYAPADGLTFNANDPVPGVWSLDVCVPGFSTFFCHVCDPDNPTVLPVELIDFVGWHDSGIHHLKWNTASEINTSHFEVERSPDGQNFQYIGQVAAVGNTTETQVYTFDDRTPLHGKNYYRLKIMDFDGTFEYSHIVLLYVEHERSVKAFPNPFLHSFTLESSSQESGEAFISIYDVAGREVHAETLFLNEGENVHRIRVEKLPAGTYWLKVTLPDALGEYEMLELVKGY